ncbi:DMT family transporter [Butyrivibrio sp. YAB3001]|uniref:DMT family transporter n=1 Tax=Butyrivibrio sp. YAB3001 TaxID=1520812 RepID=UPI0008F67671|nr:DMT family transporter [Butyrivibrio sp. YAB3001]SFD08830.1 Permease of the drug/metabolite transporter (DMT) superfamily [Butyrivibrio sp. YAB3001]
MSESFKKSIWTYFPVTFFTALFCCVLWGSASPAIKIAYDLFRIPPEDTASRIMLAGARFILAGAMTIVFGSVISKKILFPKKESVRYIAVLSLLQTIGQYFFFFMSLAYISGVRGSIINASGNFLAIIIAVYIFRLEKLSIKKLVGCIIGFSGIIVILGGFSALTSGGAITFQGEGAMLIAALFYAFSSCCIKIFSKYENPVILSGYQFMFGGAVLYLIGLFMGGSLVFCSASCAYNLIYMGFISAGAYTLWGVLLKHNPVSRVSIFGFINPVMGVLLSALFLGENKEAFSLNGILALVLVAAGIMIVNAEK